MTPKELRAAADRYRELSSDVADAMQGFMDSSELTTLLFRLAEATAPMQSHILATVQDDDDEAVTDEWWRTLNAAWFASHDDGTEVCCIVVHDDTDEDPDNRCLLVRADDGSFGFWEQSRKTHELHSPHHGKYRKLATRGDVRKLCSELGIELKEQV